MTQDEIIEMSRRAGFIDADWNINIVLPHLEAFAKLIAEKEREACAKLCAEDGVQAMDFTGGTFVGGYFAKRIMDRGDI